MITTKKFNLLKKIVFTIALVLCFTLVTQLPVMLNSANASVEMQFEQVTVTNGDFDDSSTSQLQSTPNGWSVQGSSTGKNGIIDVKTSPFRTSDYALSSTQNPSTYWDFDNHVLMLNAKSKVDSKNEQNHIGYKSNSLTLNAYSFYKVNVYALTQNNARASIYISGLDDKTANTSFEYFSSGVWDEYSFYIATGINKQTINIELWLGSKTKDSLDAVFFDHVTMNKLSGSYFGNDITSRDRNLKIIDLRETKTGVIENADFETGSMQGWKSVDALPTSANAYVISINNPESMQSKGLDYLGSDMSSNDNNYSLLMYASKKTHFGYKSTTFKVKPYETYKITVWAKLSSNFSGNAYAKLVEQDDNVKNFTTEHEANTSTITISSNTENKLTNDYTPYYFYVKGYELYETDLQLELWFGSKDNNSTGAVVFDDITFEKISWNQFDNAESSNSATLKLTTIKNDPSVKNGAFNVGSKVEKDVKYPVAPADWTVKQEEENKGIVGIINTYSPFYDANKATYGNLSNPQNPSSASGVDVDANNVLMIYNKLATYQSVTSDTLTVSKQTYQKISFDYKTVEQTTNRKLMSVYVLDGDNNVIYSDEGLYSSVWANYSVTIKASEYSNSIKLMISLGNESETVRGYLFVDNVKFEQDSSMNDETYAEFVKSHKTIDFTVANFGFFKDEQKYGFGMYTPYKYTQKLESGTNSEIGSPVAYGGIIDGKVDDEKIQNQYSITNSKNNKNSLKYMPAIRVNGKATYTLTNKDKLSLSADTYYKFYVEVYTAFSGDTKQENVKDEDKAKFGAIFALDGIDKYFTEVVTNDEWTAYTIYVCPAEAKDVSLKFGLMSNSNNITGVAAFDNFKFEKIEKLEYTQATEIAKNDKTILVISKDDTKTADNDDNKNDNKTDNENNDLVIWYLIPSLLLAVALIIAITAYFMKKVTIKKWEKKKANEYDRNSTLYRDVIRKDAEKVRDEKIKEVEKQIEDVEKEIARIEEVHKENAKAQRTTTSQVSLAQERDFKAYAKRHTALENQVESLKQKIEGYKMPEYLLGVQRNIILEKVKKEKLAKDAQNKKLKEEKKQAKLQQKQNKNK